MQSWREAMSEALYGAHGFYHRPEGPAGHFRTSAQATVFAAAVHALAARTEAGLDAPADLTVVDLGAARGELVGRLAGGCPEHWRLVAVEVAQRPPGLPARVEWATSCPAGVSGLLFANEWLDVVPVDVVTYVGGGWRLVNVDERGAESAGGEPAAADLAWLEQWWPDPRPGDRAEVGRARDDAWASVLARLDRGLAVAVDYALDPVRQREGTLTGYRRGQRVPPVPDGSCDLTAHVHLEAAAAAGIAAGATGTRVLSQRDALAGTLLLEPPSGRAADRLAALARRSELAELRAGSGLGGFTWLLQTKGIDPLPGSVARRA